jgi:hypothetical protein
MPRVNDAGEGGVVTMTAEFEDHIWMLIKDTEMRRRVAWQQIKGQLRALQEMWPATSSFPAEYEYVVGLNAAIDDAIAGIDEVME